MSTENFFNAEYFYYVKKASFFVEIFCAHLKNYIDLLTDSSTDSPPLMVLRRGPPRTLARAWGRWSWGPAGPVSVFGTPASASGTTGPSLCFLSVFESSANMLSWLTASALQRPLLSPAGRELWPYPGHRELDSGITRRKRTPLTMHCHLWEGPPVRLALGPEWPDDFGAPELISTTSP